MNNSLSVQNVFLRYPADSLMYLLALIAMMYFLWVGSRRRMKVYGLTCVFAVLFIFNPVCFKIVGYFSLDNVYYRFLWGLPIVLIIATFVVKLIRSSDSICAKAAILCLFAICVIMGRTEERIGIHLSDEDNIYGFRDDIIELSDMIENDTDKDAPSVLTDDYVFTRLRCYNADIVYKVSRAYYLKGLTDIEGFYEEDGTGNPALVRMEQLGEQADVAVMKDILLSYEFDYIIIKSEYNMEEYMGKFNYVLMGQTDIYDIYKVGTEW